MNFDFSDDLKQLRDQARRFLAEQSPPKIVRQVLEGGEPYASKLWQAMAEMGWLGAAIPEQDGGAGLGYEGLCVLAEDSAARWRRYRSPRLRIWRPRLCSWQAAIRRSGVCCRNWRTVRRWLPRLWRRVREIPKPAA